MVTQLGKSLGTEVGKLVVLPVPPQILHRIELRGIRRQVLNNDCSFLLGHKLLNHAATVRFGPIPNHQQPLFDVTLKMAEKTNQLGTSNAARMQLKVKIPPSDPGHGRKRLPVKRILQHRGLSSGRPCPTAVRTLAQPALINEHYRAAFLLGFFLSSGQRRFFHRPMAGSSRWSARPVGRWQLQPSFPNSHPTCPGWYFTPQLRSINSATRSSVQRLVSYPKACGPRLSPLSRRLRSASRKRDLRPARPAFFSPSRPCSPICFSIRFLRMAFA
jgi:hypothetical protein